MSLLSDIQRILERDLRALSREIDLFPSESMLWELPQGITNSAGTLALHGCGNLRHYIGAVMANSGYVRNREGEFGDRDMPKAEIQSIILETIAELDAAFPAIDPIVLDETFPVQVGGVNLNTRMFLLHLCTHLAFHVGQLGYLRRILTGEDAVSGAVDVRTISE